MTETATSPGSEARPLLSVEQATRRILNQIRPLPVERVLLLQAVDRFAAESLQATHALPGFDNSAMDGYAVNFGGGEALPEGTRLEVTGEQAAGPSRGLRLGSGQAIRIFTGAPVPAGTDAVVMQEDVEREGAFITLREAPPRGEFIRRAGGDLALGQTLLRAGEKYTPQRLGLLASQGLAHVAVHCAPKIALLATGDELRAPGEVLGEGEIYESNSVTLAALAGVLGAQVTMLERARDERADLDAKLALGLHQHDALVIAGGVSVGERDFVKERLAAAGVEIDLWRVTMQPGKPFLYGHAPSVGETPGTHVFGLPGNPVSAFVTFLLFVRPALLKMMGASPEEVSLSRRLATAAANLRNGGTRPHYLRGLLDAAGRFAVSGRQESHALYALSRSGALARIDPGKVVKAGETLEVLTWS